MNMRTREPAKLIARKVCKLSREVRHAGRWLPQRTSVLRRPAERVMNMCTKLTPMRRYIRTSVRAYVLSVLALWRRRDVSAKCHE